MPSVLRRRLAGFFSAASIALSNARLRPEGRKVNKTQSGLEHQAKTHSLLDPMRPHSLVLPSEF